VCNRYNAPSTFYQPRPEFKLTIEVDFELSSRIAGIAASQPVSIALPSASNAKVLLPVAPAQRNTAALVLTTYACDALSLMHLLGLSRR
jgi:hypothetical protein